MNRAALILGTTASGKSDLALKLAQTSNLPIINADSIQVYKKLEIGSAKPSPSERLQAPHYLYDYVEPEQPYTVARYIEDFKNVIVSNNIRNLIICGGSGFYLRALESGLYPQNTVSEGSKEKAQKYIAENGPQKAWEFLKSKDDKVAAKIHQNDLYRLGRSLEILFAQEKSPNQLLEQVSLKPDGVLKNYEIKKIGIFWDREKLRERVIVRTKLMISQGLIDEVKSLQSLGLENSLPLQSVGYVETLQYLRGGMSSDELIDLIVQGTMQLAKKQMTWFKRDQQIKWIEPRQVDSALIELKSWFQS